MREFQKMIPAARALLMFVSSLLLFAQPAADDRALVGQFDEIAARFTPLFERAAANVPDSSALPEIKELFQGVATFERRLGEARSDRLARGSPDRGTKTLSLLQQACTTLDFTLDALGEWVATRDRDFLSVARQGRDTLSLLRKIIPPAGSSTESRPGPLPESNRNPATEPPPSKLPAAPMSIREAQDLGYVRASYRNPEGSSSGDAVLLTLVKTGGPDRLALTIPAGLILKSPLPGVQSMIIAGLKGRDAGGGKYVLATTITLTDNQPARYIVEAYCSEFNKDNPPAGKVEFELGASADPGTVCVLNEARTRGLSIAGVQAAVWIHLERVTFSQMNARMPIPAAEWSKAETIASGCEPK